MSVSVRFLSALVRKADIATHYPGGCPAFESQNLLGHGDDHLYCALAMSGSDLALTIQAMSEQGLDTSRFVSLADMWHGPLNNVDGIEFDCQADTFPPTWRAYASSDKEGRHV